MKPIYSKDGIIDWTDEGEQAREIEISVDTQLLLKRLSGEQRKILELKSEGYNKTEISKEVKITRRSVVTQLKRIKELLQK